MNDDLIRRSDAIEAIRRERNIKALLDIPAIKPKQGKWNPYFFTEGEYNDTFNCNLCGDTFIVIQGKEDMNFCPNCGAKMKGVSDND